VKISPHNVPTPFYVLNLNLTILAVIFKTLPKLINRPVGDHGFDLFIRDFDASRPRCKLAVIDELQNLYFLANIHKDMLL
jgi:hypothetical protein